MKVILQQEAEFDLNLDKTTAIPFNTFIKLAGLETNDDSAEQPYPVVRLFKTLDEFQKEYAKNGVAYSDADVQLMNNGQICVFRRPFPVQQDTDGGADDKATQTTDAATSTETNQG